MITLRPHQEKAIQMLRHSMQRGNKRIILAAPCSFGKTRTAAWLLSEVAKRGKKGVFICDRIKLVQQALDDFDSHGLKVGVIQGQHWRYDPSADIQIASIQTLARRKHKIEFDFAIVDECHTQYESLTKYMEAYNKVPFIGLTATPYSKGLGTVWQDMVVPATTEQLLDEGYLTPVRYYGGAKVDVTKVKTRSLPTGGTDYDPKDIASRYEKNPTLNGDIVKNWLAYGEDSQTIAFASSIKHSKFLVDEFRKAGITAEHIDGYMDTDEREMLYKAHDNGEFKILSCSRLLNAGYDAPQVRCLLDCFPSKSLITHVQRIGRVLRLCEGKEYSIVLDHAGNTERIGMVEYIVPEKLDDGTKEFSERNQVKEKKESKAKECPDCYKIFTGIRCACGYEIPIRERIEHDGTMLAEIKDVMKENKQITMEDKTLFYGELLRYAELYKYKPGWAANKYRERFGVWPNKVNPRNVATVSDETHAFIKHTAIKWHKSRERRASHA